MANDIHLLCIYKCIHRVCVHAETYCAVQNMLHAYVSLVNPHVLDLARISLARPQEIAL